MAHPRMYDDADPVLGRIRGLALCLPGATEVEAWGRPTFRAGKIFSVYGAGQDWPSGLIFKPDPAEVLSLSQDPRFFVPPYFPQWLCLDLSLDALDWTEVAELLDSSYRQVATKKLIATLDAAETR